MKETVVFYNCFERIGSKIYIIYPGPYSFALLQAGVIYLFSKENIYFTSISHNLTFPPRVAK